MAQGEVSAGQRLDNFVDAAFAFAVTLLVIAGAQPLTDFADLRQALLRIPAFAVGFALVAMYWLGHRDFARLTPLRDGWTTTLSLMIVFTVLIYVFPLRFLAEVGLGFFSDGLLPGQGLARSLNDVRWAFAVYGLGAALLAGLYVALYHHAARAAGRLGLDAEAAARARAERGVWIAVGIPPLISTLLAGVVSDPRAVWLPGAVYWLIPILIFGPRLWRRRRKTPAA